MEKDLAVMRQDPSRPPALPHLSPPMTDFGTTEKLAAYFVKSGYFRDGRDVPQGIVKISAGTEIGLGPMASLLGVYISQHGKVSYGANAIASAIKSSGRYNYRVKTLDDKGCTLLCAEGGQEVGNSTFTVAEARNAS